jgi:hypothetical protein
MIHKKLPPLAIEELKAIVKFYEELKTKQKAN